MIPAPGEYSYPTRVDSGDGCGQGRVPLDSLGYRRPARLTTHSALPGINDIVACSVPAQPRSGGKVLLSDFPLTPRLPAADLDRAREWYEAKLGLTPDRTEEIGGGLWYQTGGGWFYLYPTPTAGTAQNTAAGWTVTDLEAVVEELRGQGVTFEEYDWGGGMKTEKGVMNIPGGYKAAWFKDSEGNTLELSETPPG